MSFEWFINNFRNLHWETKLLEMMGWDEEKLEAFVKDVEKDLQLHEHLDLEVFSDSLIEKGRKYVDEYYFDEFKVFMKESIDKILVDLIAQETNLLEN